jgi:UTP-glucose-1-phosphate uridylyltransferase
LKPTLLILAAGIGSRYGSLKQLDAVGPSGETIIDYSIYDAIRAGFGKVVFVIRENIEKEFREVFIDKLQSRIEVDYVLQEIDRIPDGFTVPADRQKPWGTGHAILMAAGKIKQPFAVINADDFYGRDAFRELADYYKTWTPGNKNDWCMVGFTIGNTLSEHGFVSRGVCQTDADSLLVDIVERTKIERKAEGIVYKDEQDSAVVIPENTIVSMNFWGFTPSVFNYLESGFREFLALNASNPKAEFYIPVVVNERIKKKEAAVRVLKCNSKWFGVTYREDRELVVNQLKQLVGQGIYPGDLWK